MICSPGVEAHFAGGTFPFAPGSDAVFDYLGPTTTRDARGRVIQIANPVADCYRAAAKASALQMIKERNARRRAEGKPALLPGLSSQPWFTQVAHCEPALSGLTDGCAAYYNSEWYWFHGGPVFARKVDEGDFFPALPVGYMDTRPDGDTVFANHPDWEYIPSYEGDFKLSLRQLILDDLAEQNGMVMQALTAPDGIATYPPDRLAEAQYAETYSRLRAQEEAALQIIAQTQTPQTVADISTRQTVTDPIGRLILGSITQEATGQIPHTATGQEIVRGPGQGAQPPVGTTAHAAQQLQSGAGGTPALPDGAAGETPALPGPALPGSGIGTVLLGGLAVAVMSLLDRK